MPYSRKRPISPPNNSLSDGSDTCDIFIPSEFLIDPIQIFPTEVSSVSRVTRIQIYIVGRTCWIRFFPDFFLRVDDLLFFLSDGFWSHLDANSFCQYSSPMASGNNGFVFSRSNK